MSLQQMGNCPKCGKLFIRVRTICPECFQKQENEFLTVADYLRENSGCTLQELVKATGVPMSQIRNYIITGRIILSDLPNLDYPCESCGAPIKKGKVCASCTNTIHQMAKEVEKRASAQQIEKKHSGYKSHL